MNLMAGWAYCRRVCSLVQTNEARPLSENECWCRRCTSLPYAFAVGFVATLTHCCAEELVCPVVSEKLM